MSWYLRDKPNLPVHDVEFVQILDTCYDLMEESTGLRLFDSLISHNVVK